MKALDLFSGPGGLSLGMKRAGFHAVAAVEKSRDAVETYQSHSSDVELFCADIRKLSFERYRNKIDVVFGGPPCQPFSTGGLRRGTADSRNMFPEFIRALHESRPAAFLAENVPGLASKGRQRYLAELVESFEAAGYDVTWRLVSAADYGVPQKRRRLIMVGMRTGQFWFPRPTHGPEGNQPYVPTSSVVSKSAPNGEPPDCPVVFAKYPDPRKSPYAGHVYNGGGRPINLSEPCHTILASAGGHKTHWVDTMDVAPEYTAHLMAGGAPRDGAVPGARRLTPEESALIQTFPSSMRFAGSRSSQYTQIGDAVPPLLGDAIGSALFSQLTGASPSIDTHYEPEVELPLMAAA
jgi:DNA (cytosine-5)-methyltransferase 1